jgi:tetratricopeptide (TPR) repeat protein
MFQTGKIHIYKHFLSIIYHMKLIFHTVEKPAAERKVPGNVSRSIALGIALTAFSPMFAGPMERTAYAQQSKYDSKTDPFVPDSRIKEIAASLQGNDLAKAQALFDKLHRGAPEGVKVVDGEHRAPRTASETLDDGGDCTELATVVISTLKEAGAKGRAMVVHFPNAPADEDHMVPYVMDGKKKVVIDLQAGKLGATAQGKPALIMDLTFDQATEMYHREWGDDLRDKGKTQDAIKAYEAALRFYGDDAYVHQNLGILYEKAGDMAKASKHFKKAAELDPKYAKDEKRGTYNEEMQAGETAYNAKKWAECVRHFKNALDSGEKLAPDERKTIESYRDACQQRAK